MRTRVLLIDDLEDDREIYGDGLQLLGFDVTLALTADGLRAATESTPDVIVLDGGTEESWLLCDQLRSWRRDVPVVIVTAAVRPDGSNRERARRMINCAAFVGKPCTHEDLAAVVARVTRGERGIELTRGSANSG